MFAVGLAVSLFFVANPAVASSKSEAPTEEVKQYIIRQSIASYPGNCPCPYNTMRNGRSCGKRSAYSKPGGYAPKCYPSDVTAADIAAFRAAAR